MSYQKILELAQIFVSRAETAYQQTPPNQSGMFNSFHEKFYDGLRNIINDLDGDIFVLKTRHFDGKMLKLLLKVSRDMLEIMKMSQASNPYMAANKLVTYTLHHPNDAIIDNLDFLAKHHINTTNVDFQAGLTLKHPQIKSLDKLKLFAKHLQNFMNQNPLQTKIEQPSLLTENVKDIGIGPTANSQESTNPAIPSAKK